MFDNRQKKLKPETVYVSAVRFQKAVRVRVLVGVCLKHGVRGWVYVGGSAPGVLEYDEDGKRSSFVGILMIAVSDIRRLAVPGTLSCIFT